MLFAADVGSGIGPAVGIAQTPCMFHHSDWSRWSASWVRDPHPDVVLLPCDRIGDVRRATRARVTRDPDVGAQPPVWAAVTNGKTAHRRSLDLRKPTTGQALRRPLNLFWIPGRRVRLKEICCLMYEPQKLDRPISVTIAQAFLPISTPCAVTCSTPRQTAHKLCTYLWRASIGGASPSATLSTGRRAPPCEGSETRQRPRPRESLSLCALEWS
jgi:hypothetical protein